MPKSSYLSDIKLIESSKADVRYRILCVFPKADSAVPFTRLCTDHPTTRHSQKQNPTLHHHLQKQQQQQQSWLPTALTLQISLSISVQATQPCPLCQKAPLYLCQRPSRKKRMYPSTRLSRQRKPSTSRISHAPNVRLAGTAPATTVQ